MDLYILDIVGQPRPGCLIGFVSIDALRQAVSVAKGYKGFISAVVVEGGEMLVCNEGWVQFQASHITHSRRLQTYVP